MFSPRTNTAITNCPVGGVANVLLSIVAVPCRGFCRYRQVLPSCGLVASRFGRGAVGSPIELPAGQTLAARRSARSPDSPGRRSGRGRSDRGPADRPFARQLCWPASLICDWMLSISTSAAANRTACTSYGASCSDQVWRPAAKCLRRRRAVGVSLGDQRTWLQSRVGDDVERHVGVPRTFVDDDADGLSAVVVGSHGDVLLAAERSPRRSWAVLQHGPQLANGVFLTQRHESRRRRARSPDRSRRAPRRTADAPRAVRPPTGSPTERVATQTGSGRRTTRSWSLRPMVEQRRGRRCFSARRRRR